MNPRKLHVLIVDDAQPIAHAFQRYFERYDFYVSTAESGEKALEICKAVAIDGLVTDFKMPGINGIELIRRAREIYPDLPAILISGFQPDTTNLLDKNTLSLNKPVGLNVLLTAMKTLININE